METFLRGLVDELASRRGALLAKAWRRFTVRSADLSFSSSRFIESLMNSSAVIAAYLGSGPAADNLANANFLLRNWFLVRPYGLALVGCDTRDFGLRAAILTLALIGLAKHDHLRDRVRCCCEVFHIPYMLRDGRTLCKRSEGFNLRRCSGMVVVNTRGCGRLPFPITVLISRIFLADWWHLHIVVLNRDNFIFIDLARLACVEGLSIAIRGSLEWRMLLREITMTLLMRQVMATFVTASCDSRRCDLRAAIDIVGSIALTRTHNYTLLLVIENFIVCIHIVESSIESTLVDLVFKLALTSITHTTLLIFPHRSRPFLDDQVHCCSFDWRCNTHPFLRLYWRLL